MLERGVGLLDAAVRRGLRRATTQPFVERGVVRELGQDDLVPAVARARQIRPPEIQRRVVGGEHAFEIDDQVRDVLGKLQQLADEALHREERELALELVDGDARPMRGERVRVRAAAEPLRAHRRRVIAAADDVVQRPSAGEEMQLEVVGEIVEHPDAAHTVAARVERRREDRDRHLPRQHADDAAADAALRRHADAVYPLAGVVVHAAGRHDAQHLWHTTGLDCHLAGQRADAAVRERRRHDREIARRDEHGALPEIRVEDRLGIRLDDAEVAQHEADREIPKAGLALGAIDALVDRERTAGAARAQIDDAVDALGGGRRAHETRRRDRAGVDHRIERPAALPVEADRVERVAARLDADLAHHRVAAVILEGERVHERLRDRLDGERLAGVADLVHVAVDRRDRDPEPARVGVRELRDVARHVAVVAPRVLAMQRAEIRGQGMLRLARGFGLQRGRYDHRLLRWRAARLERSLCDRRRLEQRTCHRVWSVIAQTGELRQTSA